MAANGSNLEHLKWSIQSRGRNQNCSLNLLVLFEKYEDVWKTRKFARAAQDLIAVSFSLWRAAFLAEKTGKRADVFKDGRKFLATVVEDNAISYPTDKGSKEWTFNYYTRNARSSLQELGKHWEGVCPLYEGKKRNARERWDYCQSVLDTAVANFEKLLTDRKIAAERGRAIKAARSAKRIRRRKVRQLTLENRQ